MEIKILKEVLRKGFSRYKKILYFGMKVARVGKSRNRPWSPNLDVYGVLDAMQETASSTAISNKAEA